MDATRRAIAAFAGAVVATLIARLPLLWSGPGARAVSSGGLAVGGVLWLLGCYYGYRATRTERGV